MRFRAFWLIPIICSSLIPTMFGWSAPLQERKIYTSLQEAVNDSLLVEVLDLSKSGLREFPPAISSLSNLKELYLSHNKIDELPATIGQLSKLEILDMSVNKLTTLPHEIGNLVLLRELILYRNKISVLPPSIGKLTALKKLDLWNNELEFLPPELFELKELKDLDLRGIIISYDEQKKVSTKLPGTQIHFSSPCNCAK